MNAPRRPPGRAVDGVLLLDKPAGMSSNGALQAARRLYNAKKAGHTGTLDPMATGLLPLCFGEATKFAGELLDADKSYQAVVRLGITTDSADAEGQVLEIRPVAVSADRLEQALARFRGEIEQVPPMHSALKRDGKPLYVLARQGLEVERAPRRVVISVLDLLDYDGERATLRVDCSKGTYVRSLAADLGQALGCGAHLAALRRTRIARLDLARAVTLPALAELALPDRDALLAPVDSLLADLPRIDLEAAAAISLCRGQPVLRPGLGAGGEERGRAYGAGRFLGLCRIGADGWLKPQRMVAEALAALESARDSEL